MTLTREGWGRAGFLFLAWLLAGRLRHLFVPAKNKQARAISGFFLRVFGLVRNSIGVSLAYTLYFFREPERVPLGNDSTRLYAPVDGRIVSVEEVDEPKFIGGQATCITFAISPFSVQLHRSPVTGQLHYFFIEMLPKSRTNYLGIVTPGNRRVLLTQSWKGGKNLLPPPLGENRPASVRVEVGMPLNTSQKIGVSGFGFRQIVRLYIPSDNTVEFICKSGMPSKAGSTILGRYRSI